MSDKITAAVLHSFGNPLEVVEIDSQFLPAPSPLEVRVQMKAAPINPADINILEGRYPLLPDLPAIPGMEGIGVIEKVGPGVPGFSAGQTVISLSRTGHWCSAMNANPKHLIRVPGDFPIDQASMLSVNPATAYRLLKDFADLKPGQWIGLNGATSALGHCLIQMASIRGIKTWCLVRKEAQKALLEELGATVVMTWEEAQPDEVKKRSNQASIPLGINITGGDGLRALARCIAEGGTLVTVGSMSREPFSLSNRHLIFRNITFKGFWISHWFETCTDKLRSDMFAEMFQWVRTGKLVLPVEERYPLKNIHAALEHAMQEDRFGKIVLDL